MSIADLFPNEANPMSVAKGQHILHEGESGDVMYVVLDGYVEITMKGQLLDVLGAGGFFGEMALVDGSPRIASARARTDCRLAVVDAARFRELVAASPDFSIAIMKTMAHRLRRELSLHARP